MNFLTTIRNRINSRLSTQLFLILMPAIFILVGLSAWFVHNFVIHRITEITEMSLVEASGAIEEALQHAFSLNNTDMIQQVVFDIGVQRQAIAVRLLSPDSVVLASSIPDEIGISLSHQEPLCKACHTPSGGDLPMIEMRSSISSGNVIVAANQIDNRLACQGCHSNDGQYLGLILAEFPAEPMKSWHLVFDTGLSLGALLVGFLISGVVYTTISSKVIHPLQSLSFPRQTGNPETDENEIKHLSRHIREIEEDLVGWEKRLAEQHRKIDIIFSIQYDIDDPPTLEKFFRRTLASVQKVTGYQAITMRLYEPGTGSFRIMAQSGMSPMMVKELETIPVDAGFHAEIMQTHLPAFTSDMASDPRMTSAAPIQEGYQSLACIPLMALDELLGSMQVAIKEKHIWEEDELIWLALIGRRTGLLIHHIQLTQRLRNLAVLEERSRIAQEIHDGLAQLIGSLRLWSEEALLSLEDKDAYATQKTLLKIETAARDAYASLRDEMLGLRDRTLPNKNLSAVINEYLNRFQRQWGIYTQLRLEDWASNLQDCPISPAAEIQLLRIIQEALTNVRRHANASTISVTLAIAGDWLNVRIQDNGVGFNVKEIPEDRLGLHIMRERAASVGGTIAISSQMGKGTELIINIPMRASQNIQKGET